MHVNRLAGSTSPYLKQHQHNPVDWHPWCDAVWEQAREQNKLVVVSIGYSACHWCHVMEHETFEDPEAAAFMNAHFLNVKVDREERPDVDQVYMDAVQLMTRRGGWPLNCLALPDGRPIWGGTYFQREQWLAGLNAVREVWEEDADKVLAYAEQLAAAVNAMDHDLVAGFNWDESNESRRQVWHHLRAGLERWESTWDAKHGGTLGAPKFPLPSQLALAFRMGTCSLLGEDWPVKGSLHGMNTLLAMERGGIHDHVGGGYARYSVDERWHVPHFEKMLYDNAQMLGVTAEAWSLQQHPALLLSAHGVVRFMLRELDDASGGFKSAMDADSDGEEGTYYVWRAKDLKAALPDREARNAVESWFDIGGRSHWEQGKHVLMREAAGDEVLWGNPEAQVAFDEAMTQLSTWRDSAAAGRSKPGVDDKVLTSWTALAVTGLAKAGRLMGQAEWVARAQRGAAFLRGAAGVPGEPERLRRTWHKDGGPETEGFAEDYAFAIEAMLELHQATLDPTWRNEARALMATALDRFYDEEVGTFWFTAIDSPALFARRQDNDDDVMPSANATLAWGLWRLGWACDIPAWRALAQELTAARMLATPSMERATRWAANWIDMQDAFATVVIAGPSEDEVHVALAEWWTELRPGTWVDGVWPDAANIPSWMEDKRPAQDAAVRWYVCVEGACGLPCDSAQEAWHQLDTLRRDHARPA